jgi:hypothetical protein
MPVAAYHKTFYNTIVGEYRDWKRSVKKAHWDRTATGISSLTWTVKNEVAQDVAFGIQGPSNRHFMQNGCASVLRQDPVYFQISSGSSKVQDSFTKSTYLRTSGAGQSWISVDNLAAGLYTIKAIQTGKVGTGNTGAMPFAVLTFGEKSELTL